MSEISPKFGCESWRLFATGDIQFSPSGTLPTGSWLDSDLASTFRNADLTLGNLEAPIESDGDLLAKSGVAIQTHPETATALSEYGFDVVSLANNHVMDHGEVGLQTTVEELDGHGIAHSGAGATHDEAVDPAVGTVGDVDVAVLSFCEREFGVAGPETAGAAWISHPEIPLVVSACSERYDLTVVMAHGGIMDLPIPPAQRQRQLRTLVDAGADAVLGHHPHVAQGYERYRGAPICYSLGDFSFDVSGDARGRDWGLVAEIECSGSDVTGVELHPVYSEGARVSLADGDDRTQYREYIETLRDIVEDRATLQRYWRRVASDKFVKHYSRPLANFFYRNLPCTVRHPVTYRDLWESESTKDDVRWFLNRVRNESHRWLILTALAAATGEKPEPTSGDDDLPLDDLLARVDYSYHWSKEHL